MNLFSDNIIDRHQALANLGNDPLIAYGACVAAFLAICWFLKEWI